MVAHHDRNVQSFSPIEEGIEKTKTMHTKVPASVNTATLLTQPNGIFSVAGMDNTVVSTHIAPMGLGATLPAFANSIDDPRYGFLTGFNGVLQVDGYTGYNRLTKPTRKGGDPIVVAYCWAHARRKLKEIFDRDGSEIAAEGLRQIAKIYAIEKEIRGTPPGQRLSARQARSAPLVAEFGEWLQRVRRTVSAKSRLGEKLTYIHNHWDGLQTFLTDGRVELDSNAVENLMRPIALTRKNALFAGHDEGAHAWGRIASLIATCKLNGVEPFACLKSTLEAIAAGHPQNRIDELLPWNFNPST